MNRISSIYLLLIIVLGCQNQEARRPINKQKQNFLKESAKRNKNMITIEQSLFKQLILKEDQLNFEFHRRGFGMLIKKIKVLN